MSKQLRTDSWERNTLDSGYRGRRRPRLHGKLTDRTVTVLAGVGILVVGGFVSLLVVTGNSGSGPGPTRQAAPNLTTSADRVGSPVTFGASLP